MTALSDRIIAKKLPGRYYPVLLPKEPLPEGKCSLPGVKARTGKILKKLVK
jgi:hypothetical protein